MTIIRLAGALVMFALAISVQAAPSASAFSSNPLFVPANDQTVRGEGGTSFSVAAGIEGSCERTEIVSGNVSSGLLNGNIVIRYLGCTIIRGGEETNGCSVKSVDTPSEGLILTNTLHAILGLLLPSGETGVLILPTTGATFTQFAAQFKEGKRCIPAASVTGSIAGLVSPVGSSQTTGKIKLLPGTAIDLTHGLGSTTSKLVTFSATETLTQEDSLTVGEATEVT